MRNVFVTITGVDAYTDLTKLPGNVEIGLLYSLAATTSNRYPSHFELRQILRLLGNRPSSLHVCGKKARNELIEGKCYDLTNRVQRIQINGKVSPAELEYVCRAFRTHTIITQHSSFNDNLLKVDEPNHAILVDSSGGRGITPKNWELPRTRKDVGFAGGLGSENIIEELKRIKLLTTNNFWIDMEEKLRNEDDLFDYIKAQSLVTALRGYEKVSALEYI